MSYDIYNHHRKSIRLKGYDYAQNGAYFITICTYKRQCLFNDVPPQNRRENHVLPTQTHTYKNHNLSDPSLICVTHAGEMIEKWYFELEKKFPHIRCDEYVVMPNHFHCIIHISQSNSKSVGADLCVCPPLKNTPQPIAPHHKTMKQPNDGMSEPKNGIDGLNMMGDNYGIDGLDMMGDNYGIDGLDMMGEHIGSPLHVIIQWFKTMTTNEYIRRVKDNPCTCQYKICKCNGWKQFNQKLWQRNYWEHIIRNEYSYLKIKNYIHQNPENWASDALK